MLPSFRLIAATFFCGFLVVFAGLRLATSLNDFHAALPVMAAHAAPVAIAELERSSSAAPVMYDLRFAVSTVAKAPPIDVTALLIDRTAPLVTVQPSPGAPTVEGAKEADAPVADAVEEAKPAAAGPAAQPNDP
jgi:hypothetical protein